MEMPGLWKAWKAKNRLPPLSTSPLEIPPKGGAISTFPQLRRLVLYIKERQARPALRPSLKPLPRRVGQNKLPKWAKITCQTQAGFWTVFGPSLDLVE